MPFHERLLRLEKLHERLSALILDFPSNGKGKQDFVEGFEALDAELTSMKRRGLPYVTDAR
jgi:hypothetical protein